MPQEAPQAVAEESKNCPACKKPLKRARRFYRNGAYYCNNNCFKKDQATKKAALSKDGGEATASKETAIQEKQAPLMADQAAAQAQEQPKS